MDAAEATLTLEGRRKLLQKTGSASTGTEDAFVQHVKKKMDQAADEDEASATFAVEAKISQQVCRLCVAQVFTCLSGLYIHTLYTKIL